MSAIAANSMTEHPPSSLTSVGVIFLFALIGPPLGGLIFLMTSALVAPSTFFIPGFDVLVILAIGSYLIGGAPALLVGAVAGVVQYCKRARRVDLVPVLLVSFATALVVPAVKYAGWFDWLFSAGIHVGAGLGCWFIVNAMLHWFEQRRSSGACAK